MSHVWKGSLTKSDMVFDMCGFLLRLRIIPSCISNRLPVDVDVIVVTFAFPRARGGMTRWSQSLGLVRDRVRREVYIPFHVLEVIGLGNGSAVDCGFSMHFVEFEIVQVGWKVQISSRCDVTE